MLEEIVVVSIAGGIVAFAMSLVGGLISSKRGIIEIKITTKGSETYVIGLGEGQVPAAARAFGVAGLSVSPRL